jgi:competence protein ComEC
MKNHRSGDNRRRPFRQTVKKIFLLSLVLLALDCSMSLKAQEVQIHHLGLGDGDCTLIYIIDSAVNMFTGNHLDTAVILIDAQRNSSKAATQIVDYIDTVVGKYRKKIDYVILSHLHIDHYGNMVSVLTTLKAKGYAISAVFDRTAYKYPSLAWNTDSLDNCYDSISVPGTLSASANKYLAYVKGNFLQWAINPGQDLLYTKGFMNTKFVCIAANGAAFDTTTGKLAPFIPEQVITKGGKKFKTGNFQPKSENDLSLVFLMNFQGFTYFTGGDIGGPSVAGNYSDGETPISQYLRFKNGANFHFCSFKVSHHGSAESTSPGFLTINNPTLAVVPASLRSYGSSTHPLPTCNTISNLMAHAGLGTWCTFVPKNTHGNWQDYCAYKNLLNTRDVRLRVKGLPGFGTIKIYVTTQNRNANYVLTGPTALDSMNCTKTHPVIKLTAALKSQAGIHTALSEGGSIPAGEGQPANNPPDAERPKPSLFAAQRPAPPSER